MQFLNKHTSKYQKRSKHLVCTRLPGIRPLPLAVIMNSNIHNHNTRGANALHKNRCRHVFAQKSLKLSITNIVNDTPHIILEKIDTHSLNGFTNYVKLFLLQTYQDTCTVPNCYVCSHSNTINT